MEKLLDQLKSKNPDLKTAEIKGILYIIKAFPNLTNNELVRRTGLPKETLRGFKASLGSLLDSAQKDTVSFSPAGKKALNNLDLTPYKWSLVSYEDVAVEKKLLEFREKYDLEPKREYDQFFATAKTSVAKAKVLIEKGVVDGSRIAFLGDDDWVSIALGLLTEDFKEIVVFDIDRVLLSTLEKIVRDLGIKGIRTGSCDLRRSIKEKDFGGFDVVVVDPPYTRSGVKLFLKRSLEFLGLVKNFAGKYVFLFFGNSFKSPEKTLKVQEIINSCNLVVEDKIDKFSRYYGAESIGSTSALYILKATSITSIPQGLAKAKIYTYERKKEEKFPFVDHYTFKLYGVPTRIVESKKLLLKALNTFCSKHKLKVVDTKVTRFKKGGFTITFVLGQSNLCLHTWPEYNAIHIDLITCSPVYNKEVFVENLSKFFGTQKIEVCKIE